MISTKQYRAALAKLVARYLARLEVEPYEQAYREFCRQKGELARLNLRESKGNGNKNR